MLLCINKEKLEDIMIRTRAHMRLNCFGTYIYLNGNVLLLDSSISTHGLYVYGSLKGLLVFLFSKHFFGGKNSLVVGVITISSFLIASKMVVRKSNLGKVLGN